MANDLTPGEALVLLEPNKRQGSEIFKLSLMWLLAQGHVAAREVKKWRNARVGPGHWRVGRTWTELILKRQPPAAAPADIRAVAAVVTRAPDRYADQVVRAGQESWGDDFDKLRTDVVLPQLAARRLLVVRDEPFLLFFKRRRAVLTPGGEIEKRRVERHLEDARRIPEFLDRNPAQAAALAVALGGLVLLVPELRPHLSSLAHAMRPPSADAAGSGDSGGSSSSTASVEHSSTGAPSEGRTGEPEDSANFDLGALDPAALDSLGATLDSFGSAIDSAVSDAGGDGGGGDGGGGGGD